MISEAARAAASHRPRFRTSAPALCLTLSLRRRAIHVCSVDDVGMNELRVPLAEGVGKARHTLTRPDATQHNVLEALVGLGRFVRLESELLEADGRTTRAVREIAFEDEFASITTLFEVARVESLVLKLDPEASDVALQLAELFSKRRETSAKALKLYHRVLPGVEDPAMPARRLFELYSALEKLDRAFCALGSLLLMRAATPEETKAYGLLLKKAPTRLTSPDFPWQVGNSVVSSARPWVGLFRAVVR